MPRCWEQRGCDSEMQAECPHATQMLDRCPTKCAFANCHLATHSLTNEAELIFSVEVDRDPAIKEICLFCEHFLTRGPRLDHE